MRHIAAALALAALLPLAAEELLWPLKASSPQFVSSGYGIRKDPLGGGGSCFHEGTDIACPVGTPIVAVADGVIIACVSSDPVYGRFLILRTASGMDALYGHLSETWFPRGSTVKAGQVIGLTGNTGASTGPHLHFSILFSPELVYQGAH